MKLISTCLRVVALGSGIVAMFPFYLIVMSVPGQISRIRAMQAEFTKPIRRIEQMVAKTGDLPSRETLDQWREELHFRGGAQVRWTPEDVQPNSPSAHSGFIFSIWQGEEMEEYNSVAGSFTTSLAMDTGVTLAIAAMFLIWALCSFYIALFCKR